MPESSLGKSSTWLLVTSVKKEKCFIFAKKEIGRSFLEGFPPSIKRNLLLSGGNRDFTVWFHKLQYLAVEAQIVLPHIHWQPSPPCNGPKLFFGSSLEVVGSCMTRPWGTMAARASGGPALRCRPCALVVVQFHISLRFFGMNCKNSPASRFLKSSHFERILLPYYRLG